MTVKGDLLTLIESFLFERQQRVALNGRESDNQTWCTSGFNSLEFAKLRALHAFVSYVPSRLTRLDFYAPLIPTLRALFAISAPY